MSQTSQSGHDDQTDFLANQIYQELLELLGDARTNFEVSNLYDVAATCTQLTKRLKHRTGSEKKDILLRVMRLYVARKFNEEDRHAANFVVDSMDVGIDVLFDFRKGKYKDNMSLCCATFASRMLSRRQK